MAAFAPSLGTLAAWLARRPLEQLWARTDELVLLTLEAAARTGANAVLFPFDDLVLAEAAGAELRWTPEGPLLAAAAVDVADLEAGPLLAAGRVPAATEAAGLIAPAVALAAHLPAPGALVRQLGGDPAADDQLAAAEDACGAFARQLLEAGAEWLLVPPDPYGPGPLRRLADHFGATLAVPGEDPGVAVVGVKDLADPAAAPSAAGAELVLTDAPVPADADLAVWARQAHRLTGEGP
jgi:uroporphyrinogen-III decarboxylase